MKKLLIILIVLFVANNIQAQDLKTDTIQKNTDISDKPKDSSIYSRLDPNQIYELELAKIKGSREDEDTERPKVVIIFFLSIIALVFTIAYFQYKQKAKIYQLYQKSLEMGKELPEEFFKKPKQQQSYLQKGIFLVALGIGFCIAFSSNSFIAPIGAIPIFGGAACILVHFLDKKNTNSKIDE